MALEEYDGHCINWRVRSVVLGLDRVRPDLLRVTIDGYAIPLTLQRIVRTDEDGERFSAYVPVENPDLGNYRDPIEAVRGAISAAFEAGGGHDG